MHIYILFVEVYRVMLEWIKKNWLLLVILLVASGLMIYFYGCYPRVKSLLDNTRMVTRQELQLEFNQIIDLAEIRILDLDRQDKIRTIIMENALVLVRGQPLNPVGIITAVAAVYGAGQAGCSITKKVKEVKRKRKVNNG